MQAVRVDNDQIKVNKKDVLRYLSYKSDDLDKESQKLFDESLAEIKDISKSFYVYDFYDITKDENKIYLKDTDIVFKSDSLQKFYRNSCKTAVFVTTLGFEIEERIKYYNISNLSKAIIFDALASAFIEGLCDITHDKIKMEALLEGYTSTARFSPGYGDVPISHQKDIIKALNAQKLIGVSVLDSSLLMPRKSVTALVGLVPISQSCKL